jgi:hypothetical protein
MHGCLSDSLLVTYRDTHATILGCVHCYRAHFCITDGHWTASLECNTLPQSGRSSKGRGTAPYATDAIVPKRPATKLTGTLLHLGTCRSPHCTRAAPA